MRKFLSISIILITFTFHSDTLLYSQNKPATKTNKTKKTSKIEEAQIDKLELSDQEVPPPVEVSYQDSYNSNSRYTYERLDDNWSIVKDRYADTYKNGLVKNGKIFLPMIFNYSYSNSFNRGLKKIILNLDKNYGVFDLEKEKWSIPLGYNSLYSLDNNLLVANKDGKYGVIDFENKIIADFNWKSISKLNDGNYVIVQNNQNMYGILNIINLKLTIPCIYKYIDKNESTSGFIVQNQSGQKSIVTINNEQILKNWYDEIYTVSNRRNLIVKKSGKYGIIDDQENIILPIEYNSIKSYPYNDGSYLAQNAEGKFGCVAIDGKITLPFEYDQLNESSGQSILVSNKKKRCGIVQVNQGLPTEILTCDYDDIQVNRQTFIISKAGKYGILDNFGKIITPLEYDMITLLNERDYSNNNLFIANKNQRLFILNNMGQKISEKSYKSLSKLTENNSDYYSTVFQGIKFIDDKDMVGVLDQYGQELIPPIYNDIESMTKSLIVFKQKNNFGIYNYINKKEIAAPIYNQILLTKKGYIGIKGNDFYTIDLNDPSKTIKLK